MAIKKLLLALLIVVAAIAAFFAWTAWYDGSFGVPHLVGLGASVLILVLIWFWPGNDQPRRPPP